MTPAGLRAIPRTLPSVSRIVGRIEGSRAGPTLVVIGGLHGNEPAGILAVRQVLDGIRSYVERLRGIFVAIAGNRGALARGRRFVEEDLNRIWTSHRIRSLQNHPEARTRMAESREQMELLGILDRIIGNGRGAACVMDLHTTSSVSGAWITVEDTPANRRFVQSFPVPAILGLEERVEGTLLAHLVRAGHVGMGFEGGQHEDPRSVDRIRAAIWLGLEGAGMLRESETPEIRESRLLLGRDSSSLPRILEVRHRHEVGPADGFRMKPGFVNLQPIRAGEILAHDAGGEIRSPEEGRLLMPLYQKQGRDGFFVVREVRPGGDEGDSPVFIRRRDG